jgi:protein-ribulosamine 3-kinase
LNLDEGDSSMAPHGGSGFSSTFKLSGTKDGRPASYFVKTGSGTDAEVMFRG